MTNQLNLASHFSNFFNSQFNFKSFSISILCSAYVEKTQQEIKHITPPFSCQNSFFSRMTFSLSLTLHELIPSQPKKKTKTKIDFSSWKNFPTGDTSFSHETIVCMLCLLKCVHIRSDLFIYQSGMEIRELVLSLFVV